MMNDLKINYYLSIPGIIAPILSISLVIVLGYFEPGYNHFTTTMSVLGGVKGIRGDIFNIRIAVTGILIIFFAIGLHRSLNEGKGSKIGPLMVILGGLGLISAAIFHCNQDCVNNPDLFIQSGTGILHGVSAFIIGMDLAVAPIAVYFRFKKDPK